MTRQEFLEGLRTSLQGEVPAAVLQENLHYYDDYITAEMKNGRAEHEVIDEIGDPRLIARTIIDTSSGGGTVYETYEDNEANYRQERSGHSQNSSGGSIHYYDLNKWYVKLAAVAILILVIVMIMAIVGGLLSLLIPLLPLIGVIVLIMWLLQGPRK